MIAIVVPCYNEAARFDLGYWREVIEKTPNSIFVFVNDGSSDNTQNLLASLKGRNAYSLNLPINLGKGEAIRSGLHFALRNSKPEILGFLDSDGAFGLADIQHMIELAHVKFSSSNKITCLIASRVALSGRNIERSQFRHYLGRLIVSYVCLGWKNAPYDTQSGFKLFLRDPVFIQVISTKFATRWFFDIEILLRLSRKSAGKVWEAPLENWRDVKNSKINIPEFKRVAREIRIIRKLVRSANRIGQK